MNAHPTFAGTPGATCARCYGRTYGVALACAVENGATDDATAYAWASDYVETALVDAYPCDAHAGALDYAGTVLDTLDDFDMGPALSDDFTLACQRQYGYANDIVLLTHRATGDEYVAAVLTRQYASDVIAGYAVLDTFATVLDTLDAARPAGDRWRDADTFAPDVAPAYGTRVRTLPHTDAWMRGVRFGNVTGVTWAPDGRTLAAVHVRPEMGPGRPVSVPADGYALAPKNGGRA